MTHHPARPRYLTAALLSFALAIALLLAVALLSSPTPRRSIPRPAHKETDR